MRNLKIIILHSPWAGAGNFSKMHIFRGLELPFLTCIYDLSLP